MSAVCKHAWSESFKVETRNPHERVLHHKCVEAEGHLAWTRPIPHRCACDPVPELHVDYVPDWDD